MSDSKPKVGDRVSVLYPGTWERRGKVVETDYHPLGVDDAVKVNFDEGNFRREPEWWSARYVRKL